MAIPPSVVSDFILQPATLNTTKHGKRAKFSGDNSIVERLQREQYFDGCVAYTGHRLPLGQVWQLTALATTWRWGGLGGLVSGCVLCYPAIPEGISIYRSLHLYSRLHTLLCVVSLYTGEYIRR